MTDHVEFIDQPLCLDCLQPDDPNHGCIVPDATSNMADDAYVGKHERRDEGEARRD